MRELADAMAVGSCVLHAVLELELDGSLAVGESHLDSDLSTLWNSVVEKVAA